MPEKPTFYNDLSQSEPFISEFTKSKKKAAQFTNKKPPKPTVLSKNEVAVLIWLFIINGGKGQLKGIYRNGVYEFLKHKGYYKRYREDKSYILIKEEDNIITEVEISQIQDELTGYARLLDQPLTFDYLGVTFDAEAPKLLETLHNNIHLLCNHTALRSLENHTKPNLFDTASESYFPFLNCVVKVAKDSISQLDYHELQGACIWKEHIIQHEFHLQDDLDSTKCHFSAFIRNVANNSPDRINGFRSAIGYLLHNYSSPSQRVAVIAYDEEITDAHQPQGGTGKGLLAQGLRQLRRVSTIDGKKFDPTDRFCFQDVNERSQLVYFDDVMKDFDFMRLNSTLTEGWQNEQKNKPAFRIDPKHGPKTYITSNYILKGEGVTVERRQFILEFSPFYSKLVRKKMDPIVDTHGCTFFDGESWDSREWDNFFYFMIQCTQYYLREGLQFYKSINLGANKLRQNTNEDFSQWITDKDIQPGIEYNLSSLFSEFKEIYFNDDNDFKMKTFTKWIGIYSQTQNFELENRRSNHILYGTFKQKSHKAT